MKILALSSTFPYPPTRGGTQVRTFNLLKYLSQNHHITLLTHRESDVTDEEISELRGHVDKLVVFDRPSEDTTSTGTLTKIRRLGRFLLTGTPPSVINRYSSEMQIWTDNFIRSGECDLITCEHSVNEIYIRPEYKHQVKTIVNVHSSVYGTCLNQLVTKTSENQLRDRINLPLLHRYEKKYCSKFKHIIVTTSEDQQQLQAFNHQADITVIPNGVDLVSFHNRSHDPGGKKIIFIGAMDNLANIDSVCFFSEQVLPGIHQKYPDATFDIVGSRPAPEVLELGKKPGINVMGRVPSMAEYLHQSTVCVVPMRTGFGIKNKTLEAMAAGIPVVASDRGLEGLDVDSINTPIRALRANQPTEYINAISQLFEQPQLRQQISMNARQLIENQFTWEMAGKNYEQICLK